MNLKRIDFEQGNDDWKECWSFLYDEDVVTEEQAEHIINKMYTHDNYLLKNDLPCFFLPTSKADLLKKWVHEFIKKGNK